MAYPTHSFAMVLSVTGARATSVSCLGFDDSRHEDQVFGKGKNVWDNPFSNETAICHLSDGSVARLNEFRRIGISHINHVRLSLYGDLASFEEQASSVGGHRPNAVWSTLDGKAEDLGDLLNCAPAAAADMSFDTCLGLAQIHDAGRLPKSYHGQRNGHYGSHQFLVDDFVTGCLDGKHPVNNVWDAARYNAPGIIAHASALRGGELMKVPDFGSPFPRDMA